MNAPEIIGGIFLLLISIAITLLVLVQEGSRGATNALTGSSSDSYFGKNSGRSREATLGRYTKYASIAFMLITVVVYILEIAVG
ncbi:preprotein translocase subunit SecG [Oscillospiraceae bacterium MB08-C2-2]|nr:preprotein translocase subunit SecG [Oscillospiraceae bacterium MB08-C2-2]